MTSLRVDAVVALAAAALLVAACSGPPTATPTVGQPTASPTATSSVTAGATASVTASPSVSPAAGPGFGAATLLFEDDFSADDMGWQKADESWGAAAIADGVMTTTLNQSTFVTSSVGPIADAAWPVVRVEATVERLSDGSTFEYPGLLCGSADRMIGGALGSNGWRVFIALGEPNVQILDLQTDGPSFVLEGRQRLALECAGTSTGPLRMQVWLDDVLVAAYVDPGASGPAAFDRIGFYFEGGAGSVLATDDVAAYGGSGEALPPLPGPTPSATAPAGDLGYEALLEHIPAGVAEGCFNSDSGEADVVALCIPDDSLLGPSVELAFVTYLWFEHFADADAYFGDRLDELGDQPGEDCSVGPSHYVQEVDGELGGRVLCAGDPAQDPLELYWADYRLGGDSGTIGWISLESDTYADLGALFEAAQLVP